MATTFGQDNISDC